MSFTELFFIMVLGLILFGPEELPKIARTVGRMVFEIKKATQDVQSEMHKSIYEVKPSPVQDEQNTEPKLQATEGSETIAAGNEKEFTGLN